MPKIIKTPKIKTVYPMGILRPDGTRFKRKYQTVEQRKRFQKFYKDKGFKTRAI